MASILIVDDEPAIRRLLAAAFTQAGYQVQTACNGLEARKIFAAERFDIVLSDVLMPSMNGHELAQWIDENSPQTPTVLMTGYDLGCETCPRASRCRVLLKPFLPNKAVALVAEVLSMRSS
jgi:DNA-binding NtrC family response regulator